MSAPDFLAGGRIEAQRHFIGIDASGRENLVSAQNRRGIARADGHFPFLGQFLGPRGGGFESATLSSRPGPRHWGQSPKAFVLRIAAANRVANSLIFMFIVVSNKHSGK